MKKINESPTLVALRDRGFDTEIHWVDTLPMESTHSYHFHTSLSLAYNQAMRQPYWGDGVYGPPTRVWLSEIWVLKDIHIEKVSQFIRDYNPEKYAENQASPIFGEHPEQPIRWEEINFLERKPGFVRVIESRDENRRHVTYKFNDGDVGILVDVLGFSKIIYGWEVANIIPRIWW